MQVTPNGGSAVDAETRGRFFIARNVPLDSKADNSIVASTSATTLADHSPSSDTVLNVGLDQNIMWSFSYNANGDLTEKLDTVHNSAVQWSYCYSVDGWLTKATKIVDSETVFTEEYSYDPIGRKYGVKTTDGTGSTERYFAYDGGSIVLELEEDSGDYLLEKEFVRGLSLGGGIGGLLYVRDVDESVGYLHYDGRGNVVSITDDSREEVAYYEYDAWGNILTACGSLANEFAFSTKQASLGTGLIDFGYRWYDPQTGRWTQRDPIGIAGGHCLYAFCFNSPCGFVDPWGRNGEGTNQMQPPDHPTEASDAWARENLDIEYTKGQEASEVVADWSHPAHGCAVIVAVSWVYAETQEVPGLNRVTGFATWFMVWFITGMRMYGDCTEEVFTLLPESQNLLEKYLLPDETYPERYTVVNEGDRVLLYTLICDQYSFYDRQERTLVWWIRRRVVKHVCPRYNPVTQPFLE